MQFIWWLRVWWLRELTAAVVLLSALGGQQALAAPVPEEESSSGLVSRNGGTGHTSSDPVEVVWKQNTKSQTAFEIDCYAILCQKKKKKKASSPVSS